MMIPMMLVFGFWEMREGPKEIETVGNLKNEATMGVSENNVPLNPMVDDHYPY